MIVKRTNGSDQGADGRHEVHGECEARDQLRVDRERVLSSPEDTQRSGSSPLVDYGESSRATLGTSASYPINKEKSVQ